jgi:hypothetical protein
MSRKEISLGEFERRINDLITKSTPVMCFFVSKDGTNVTLFGSVESAVIGEELAVATSPDIPAAGSRIRIPLDRSCLFGWRDHGDLPPSNREELVLRFGDSCLEINLPSGAVLYLFFTAPK